MNYPELTPNEIKGVDLCVKGLKKKYTFITGWDTVEDYTKYNNVLFITITVDYYKLSDYYGLNIRENMKWYMDKKDPEWWGNDFYSLLSYMDIPEGSELSYEIRAQMNERLNLLYEALPEELQRTWVSEYGEKIYPINLSIQSFYLFINN